MTGSLRVLYSREHLRGAWRATSSLIYNKSYIDGRGLFLFSLIVLVMIMISRIKRVLYAMTAVRGVGRIVRVDLRVH